MRKLDASLAVGVLCAAMAACSSSASNPSPPSGPPTSFALTGRVTDATTNSPLAANVSVLDGPNISRFATSDATGAFRIANLAMGGFTVGVRSGGYDSAFLGVNLVRDTSVDFRLTPVMTTLAGTWAGFVAFSTSTGSPQTITVLQATLMQTGANVSSDMFPSSGPYQAGFSFTLQDPSAIGSTTGITGTLTLVEDIAGRSPMTCRGTSTLTGTINWTRMFATAQPNTSDCGTTYSNVTMSFVRQQ